MDFHPGEPNPACRPHGEEFFLKLQIGIDGKTYEVEVEVTEEDNHTALRGPSHLPPPVQATVQSTVVPTALKPVPPAGVAVDEAKVCRSPVAGVVVKISAQPGQDLKADDLILVLEAMKMETNVTAPVAGKVKRVNVKEGDGVQVNQILAEFE